MKTSTLKAALVAGTITAYTTTVLQITDGPGNILKRARIVLRERIETPVPEREQFNSDEEFRKARLRWEYRTANTKLLVCGWCLSPYVGVPVYAIVKRSIAKNEKGIAGWLVGAAFSVSVAALLRHTAEIYS